MKVDLVGVDLVRVDLMGVDLMCTHRVFLYSGVVSGDVDTGVLTAQQVVNMIILTSIDFYG